MIKCKEVVEILIEEVKKANINKIQLESDLKSYKERVKKVMSTTKISSTVHKSSTYEETISDLIHLCH